MAVLCSLPDRERAERARPASRRIFSRAETRQYSSYTIADTIWLRTGFVQCNRDNCIGVVP